MSNILKIKIKTKNVGLDYQVLGDEGMGPVLVKFEKDYTEGKRSFAIGSTHYKNSQEKCLISVCSYFNKNRPKLNLLVISFDIQTGFFSKFLVDELYIKGDVFKFSETLSFLDWSSLVDGSVDVLKNYNIVLWDLPELSLIQENEVALSFSFSLMDSLYIVSSKDSGLSEMEFQKEIAQYYHDHGLDIQFLFNENTKPKRTLWRFIYLVLKKIINRLVKTVQR